MHTAHGPIHCWTKTFFLNVEIVSESGSQYLENNDSTLSTPTFFKQQKKCMTESKNILDFGLCILVI